MSQEHNTGENEVMRGMKQAGQAGKQVGKKVAKTGIKVAGKLGKKAIASLIAMVGAPAIIIGIIILIVLLFFTSVYWAMPESGMLTGVNMELTEEDEKLKEEVTKKTDDYNVKNTYLVFEEGSYYPKKMGSAVKEFMDKEGKDIKLANQWGDLYSPMLWKSNVEGDETLIVRLKFSLKELDVISDSIKPYFYYKPSTVTVCSTDSEGETTCYTYDVYLLVEAFTIRGHNLYSYEWVTEGDEDSSITYEKLKDIEVIDDGKEYFNKFLEKYFKDLGKDEEELQLTSDMIWENMQGFTAESEWMAWLDNEGYIQSRLISSSAIPVEYRGFLEEASSITGIPVNILAAIISKESSWDVNAVNFSSGCFGLTQLHPDYWEAWALRYGFNPETDKSNPRAQIIIGAQVLAGYFPSPVSFESNNWYADSSFRAGMAKYGGYGSNVEKAGAYIDDIVNLANAFNKEAVWPVPSRTIADITSPFGWRGNPTAPGSEFHDGIDIAGNFGEPVVSASGGIVVHVGYGRGYGQAIFIEDGTYMYIYGHLDSVNVSAGQIVNPSQKIGEIGSTGRSTGPHLHFGIQLVGGRGFVDPLTVISI